MINNFRIKFICVNKFKNIYFLINLKFPNFYLNKYNLEKKNYFFLFTKFILNKLINQKYVYAYFSMTHTV